MKITYLNSASVLIEDKNVKILCDPWLDGEEYFGSWGIYPPYDFRPEIFDDVDFIHISHIHPCLLYTSPSPRDLSTSRMPSSA